VTILLPDRDSREPNCSVLVAAFHALQRKPWQQLALKTRGAIGQLLLYVLFAASLAILLASAAHARTVEIFHADVPFKFSVGNRTFRPGRYDLVFVGQDLIAVRDSHSHIIASVVTRSRAIDGPAPVSKLVFSRRDKVPQLKQIWLENRTQVLDVLGEEMVMRPAPPPPAELPSDITSLFERRPAPGYRY